jgi:hypothetical protein
LSWSANEQATLRSVKVRLPLYEGQAKNEANDIQSASHKNLEKRTMRMATLHASMTIAIGGMVMSSMAFAPLQQAQACSRVLYETGNRGYITGRTMDWADASAKTALWVFP